MRKRRVASIVAWGLAAAASGFGCTGGNGEPACPGTIAVDLAAAPETARMLADLADRFNASGAARPAGGGPGACARVVVHTVAAHRAEALLAGGWQRAPDEMPAPVVWAPGASTWATVLDVQRVAAGDRPMAADVTPIARTPLVVALPRSRAEVLGWPDRPIRLADLLRLAGADLTSSCSGSDAPAGMRLIVERWCAEGWGPFRLGKAHPSFSASGLGALVVQAYAATGETEGLEVENLDDPWVVRFTGMAEAAVAHYGESPRRFLDALYRADTTATANGDDGGDGERPPAPAATAVVVEEKVVVDYNRGDPAGTLGPGEAGTRPRDRLVALYPAEGTVELDDPLIVLDAPWVGEAERAGARRFVGYVRSADVQRRVLDYGYRPVEPTVEVEGPLFSPSGYGVEPAPAVPTLPVPDATLLAALRDGWHDQRRPARVLLVVDVSGSMGDPSDIHDLDSPTKLDLAKRALGGVLDLFEDDDEVGLWVFSTALEGPGTTPDGLVRGLVPLHRMDAGRGPRRQRQLLADAVEALRPRNDTALYAATGLAHAALDLGYAPDRIDAVVLLTDGHDEVDGGPPGGDDATRSALLDRLSPPGDAPSDRPVPIFTVAYGGDADVDILRRIADASGGAFYDSTDPASIDLVLAEAVSNL